MCRKLKLTLVLPLLAAMAAPLRGEVYIIPHFVTGPGPARPLTVTSFTTSLTIANPNSTQGEVTIRAFADDGTELLISENSATIAPFGTRVVSPGLNEFKVGWLRVDSNQHLIIRGSCSLNQWSLTLTPPPVCGLAPVSSREADPVSSFSNAVVPVTVILNGSCASTGIAIASPGDPGQSASVELTLTGADGTEVGSTSLEIEAGHQRAFTVEEVFPEVLELFGQTFQLRVSSDRPVFGTTVFFDEFGEWRTVDFEPVQ
ncbi:MAG: hypothetical protein P8020_16370 [Acidobacteriota bacterium]